MKKFYFVLVTALLFAAIAINNTGCKPETVIVIDTLKQGPEDPGGVTGNGMSLKINGAIRKATGITANIDQDGLLVVRGTLSGTEYIMLMVSTISDDPIVAGTYDFDGPGGSTYVQDITALDKTFLGDEGKVIITSISSDKISGTFECTTELGAAAGPVITEGQFSSNLTRNSTP